MRILVIGKHGFVSTCFQKYMKRYSDITVDAISVRDGHWKEYDFHSYDAVFNATGLAHDDARKGTREQFMYLNATLPCEIAQKAKSEGVELFINMSSLIIYGEMSELGKEELITSNTIPTPAGIYGESKLAGEKALNGLVDQSFKVAIIRSPLVYNENAVDNFLRLKNYALKFPIFPNIKNARSMVYSDNLCELVKLICEHKVGGYFYPQQEKLICTSKLVKDLARVGGNKLMLIKMFNPIIFMLSKRMLIFRKVFGSLSVDLKESNHFDGRYRVVDYNESLHRLVGEK